MKPSCLISAIFKHFQKWQKKSRGRSCLQPFNWEICYFCYSQLQLILVADFSSFRFIHSWNWHSVSQCCDQLWLSQKFWDLFASHWSLRSLWTSWSCYKSSHTWWQIWLVQDWTGAGYRDQTFPSGCWQKTLCGRVSATTRWRWLSTKILVGKLKPFFY